MKNIFNKKEKMKDQNEKEALATKKSLKKMSRVELLEILIDQSTELERYKEELQAAREELEKRSIHIEKAGSIAEASLALNDVFESSQAACEQYIENIKHLSEKQEKVCKQMETDSQIKADKIIAEAIKKRNHIVKEAELSAERILSKAKVDSEKYWEEISDKLSKFYDSYSGLKELLSIVNIENRRSGENE